MKPRLPQQLVERRYFRPGLERRRSGAARRASKPGGLPRQAGPAPPPQAAANPLAEHEHADTQVHRVRNAGGPEDQAFYTCECGYVFRALVSTTVQCPHCRGQQAW